MSELVPMSLGRLLRRAFTEFEKQQKVYDLPVAKWYRGAPELDLSVQLHGKRAETPLGPAAGPHSQLAQNIVLSWLGGARIIELKTVQVKDDLEIPRPCIDAANVGYNVEWSQELTIEQSITEYVKASMLIQILASSPIADALSPGCADTIFDISVGYDLAGIRSTKVQRFFDSMQDASEVIARLRQELSGDLARYRDLPFEPAISNCVTLSTFHGCPADEIEAIGRHLLEQVGVNLVVKLNPTLLGYQPLCELLNVRLGYREIKPVASAFEHDLQWQDAIALLKRLAQLAHERGKTLGAKFTNTLVVENHKSFFPGEAQMYLSGAPLHPISMSLALRFREAVGHDFPISFSGGIDAKNFPDASACGMVPITTCTDLLRPGGYGRLAKYLVRLEAAFRALGVTDLASYHLAAHGAAEQGVRDPGEASLINMRAVVSKVLADPRYRRHKNAAIPRKVGSQLVIFDCLSCDKCVPVCPNDANFAFETEPAERMSQRATCGPDGAIAISTAEKFSLTRTTQYANFADFCNDCGNCDIFCPEDGGPYVEKPRFFGSQKDFESAARHGGFYIEASAELARVWARIGAINYRLDLDRASREATFSDGVLQLDLDRDGAIHSGRVLPDGRAEAGHSICTHAALSMLTVLDAVLDATRPNPVNASLKAPSLDLA